MVSSQNVRNKRESRENRKQPVGPNHRTRYRSAILQLIRSQKTFTADDVAKLVKRPSGFSPRAIGPIFHGMRREGLIRSVGATVTTRREAKCRLLRVWEAVPLSVEG